MSSDIIPSITLDNPLSPLFFWIIVTYLIILFYTFRISEFENQIEGTEKLFIAGAIGTCFFVIYSTIYNLFLTILILLISKLYLAAEVLPISFNVFMPDLHSAGDTFPEYLALILGIIWIIYIIFSILFYGLTKLIQFCLDPNGSIFQKYRRFQAIKEYNFLRIIFFSITYTFASLIITLLYFMFLHGYLSNVFNLHFTGRDVSSFLVTTSLLIAMSLLMYAFIWSLLKDCGTQIIPIAEQLYNKYKKFSKYLDDEKAHVGKYMIASMKKYEFYLLILLVCFILFLIINKVFYPVTCTGGACVWSP